MSAAASLFELLFIFVALPLAYRFGPFHIPVLPLLWGVTAYALWQLLRDPKFDHSRLWNASAFPAVGISILLPFVISACLIWLGVHHFAPGSQWSLLRRNPALWSLVMIAYPVLSVYPQGLIYRAFFFPRYAGLFPGRWGLIFASAIAFSFMHIIFRNWIAVGLTFAGGLLFACRYAETGSLCTSSVEHALYGCWIFTVGLGQFFYHGTIRTLGSLTQK